MSENKCLCGSDLEYESCCALYIEEGNAILDAATMVRSRFVAYSLEKYDYIIKSSHPDIKTDLTADRIKKNADGIKWLKLELGQEQEYVSPEGECFKQISFVAHYERDNKAGQLSETSFFKEQDGRLYYVHGVNNKPPTHKRTSPKIGRNEICTCGSNRKYKKCCGKQV